MKKTLITLAALASMSVAGAASIATDEYDLTDFTDGKLELKNSLSFDSNWSIGMVVVLGSGSFNEWGTPIIATGTDAVAVKFYNGFQLYYANGTKRDGEETLNDIQIKLNSEEEKTIGNNLVSGTYLFINIHYDATSRELSVMEGLAGAFETSTATILANAPDITHLCTGLNSGDATDWQVLSFNVETVAPATPEPATASLSLLGLAALMMRRRRA